MEVCLKSKDEIFEAVRKVVTDELGVPSTEITLESNYSHDLGADDLDLIELAMSLEDEFGIDIPDDVIAKVVGDPTVPAGVKVQATVDWIATRLETKGKESNEQSPI